MPQGFGSSSLPPRLGVRGPGDGDRVLPQEDREGHVQAPSLAVKQLPARVRPDGRHLQ